MRHVPRDYSCRVSQQELSLFTSDDLNTVGPLGVITIDYEACWQNQVARGSIWGQN